MQGLLGDELTDSLLESIPCRETQIRQLVALLDPRFPSSPTIVIHGHEATGKTLTLKRILESIETSSAIVRSHGCITSRHLLERTISASIEALSAGSDDNGLNELDGRCESISSFVVQLQRICEGRGKLILVFDGIDQQREALPTLISAIARLGEVIPSLTVILVVHTPRLRALNLAGVPHVQFPPYNRAESLDIVSSSPLAMYDPSTSDQFANESNPILISDEDQSWLWTRFVTAVWDSIGQAAARDLVSFRVVCTNLWQPFVKPVLEGHYTPREFSKLVVKNRALFQSELPLKESVLSFGTSDPTPNPTRAPSPIFPYFTAHLLCAAYLASHTPPRYDMSLFSKSSLRSRRRKKAGGGGGQSQPRTPKSRKPSRHLLGPQAFPLERLFAIFHAILPSPAGGGRADLMEQVATLRRLRLLVRGASVGDEGVGGGKWRVGCGLEFAKGVARGIGLDLEEFLME